MYNYKKYVICVAVAIIMGVVAAISCTHKDYQVSLKEESDSSYIDYIITDNEDSETTTEDEDVVTESICESIEDESSAEDISSDSSVTSDSIIDNFGVMSVTEEYEPIIIEVPIEPKVSTTQAEQIPKELEKAVESTPILVEETPTEVACVADYTPYELYNMGRLYWGDYQYTWYSERVLPGYGLDINGRYTDADGFVCDGDGYICVAASSLSKGTVVDTPFGRQGKVYDSGCAWGTIDVYVNW